MLEIDLLGPLRVRVDEAPVDVPRGHSARIVAALALAGGRPVSLERVAEVLYDDEPPARWETSVYSTLSRLRRLLGPAGDRLRTSDAGYHLELAPGAIDSERFEARARAGRDALARGDPAAAVTALEDALACWRGAALEGVRDAAALRGAATNLDEARLAACEALLDARLAAGDHDAVVVEARRLVVEAPFREQLWSQLALALYRAGRQRDALAVLDELRRLLRDELGVEPGPAVRDLERALLDHDPALQGAAPSDDAVRRERPRPDASVGVAVRAVTPARPPWLREPDDALVGRERDVDLARAAVEHVRATGETRVLSVEGEAGIGKTRLVSHLVSTLDGWVLLAGRGDEAEVAGYQPFADALAPSLRALTGGDAVPPALAALGFVAPQVLLSKDPSLRLPEIDDADAARAAVVEAMAALRGTLGGPGPVVLVIDDAQWAPEPSVRLLRQIVRSGALDPLLVVLTVRPHETGPELAALLDDWRRDRMLARVALAELAPGDVEVLVESRGGDAALAERVRSLGGGNPFFVEELVRHLREGDSSGDGVDRNAPVPENVRATVARRLRRLPDETRRALGAAAVVGQEFSIDLVAAVLDDDVDVVGDALDAAIAAGLVRDAQPRAGWATFAHAIVREVLQRALGSARSLRLHERVADALEAAGGDEVGAAAVIALHRTEAVRDAASARRALAAAMAAAAEATRVRDHAEAARVLERALRRAEELLSATDRAAVDARIACIEARGRAGATEEAYDELTAIAIDALDRGDGSLAAHAMLAAMWWTSIVRPDEPELHARLITALGDANDDEAIVARLWALDLQDRSRFEAAWPTVRATLAELEARGAPDRILARAYLGAQSILELVEPPEATLPLLRRAVAAAQRSGDAQLRLVATSTLRVALVASGEPDEARALEREHERRARDSGIPRYLAGLEQRRAAGAILEGRFGDAEAHALRAYEIQPTVEMFEGLSVQIFAIRKEQARFAEVRDAVEAVAAASTQRSWRAGFAMVCAELGDFERAHKLAGELAPDLDLVMPDPYGSTCLALLAETAELLADAELARRVLPHLDRIRQPVLQFPAGVICWGALDRLRGPLLVLAGEPDAARAAFERSIALHERLGARPFLARDRLGLARLHAARGDTDAAAALRAQGLALAQHIGATRLLERFAES
jgi:DNA-binding SARP family transcriptional activator